VSFSITINYGTGDVSLTNYGGENLVYSGSLKKTYTIHSKTYRPVSGQAWFSFQPKPSLMGALFNLDRDQEITVAITEDGSPWFTGYVRPITKFKDSTGKNTVNVECVDAGWMLHKKPSSAIAKVAADSMVVCDTTTTANSLIHWILTSAGFTGTITAFDINSSIDYFRISNKDYFDVLSDLCFSYHCSFYFDDSGNFQLYNWGESSPTSASTINEADIIKSLSIDRGTTSADTPVVVYYIQQVKSGVQVGNAYPTLVTMYPNPYSTADWDAPHGPKGWLTASDDHTYYLTYENATLDELDGIISEYARVTMRTSPRAFPGAFVDHGTYYEINICSTKSRAYNVDTPGTRTLTNVQVTTAKTDDGASIRIDHGGAAESERIERLQGLCEAAVSEEAGRATGPDVGPGTKEWKARYCYSDSVAAEVATALSKNLENGEYVYKWDSEDSLSVGSYYTISNNEANRVALCRIKKATEKVRKGGSKLYSYEATQYEGLGTVFNSVVTGENHTIEIVDDDEQIGIIEGPGFDTTTDAPPTEDGLYLAADKFGYYDYSADNWPVVINNDGTFKFEGAGGDSIEFDGADLTVNADVALNGTVAVGDDIQSSNYNAGVAGFKIEGNGDAEFNSLTIRSGAVEEALVQSTTAVIVGFDGTGSTSSPDEGDRRVIIDSDEISFQEYTDGAWSSYNQVSLCGVDSDGKFYPFISCRGVLHPQSVEIADADIGEAFPGGHVYTFEDDLLDQNDYNGLTASSAGRTTGWSKFGSYSVAATTSGGNLYALESQMIGWNGDPDYSLSLGRPMAIGGWIYRSSDGTGNQNDYYFLSVENQSRTYPPNNYVDTFYLRIQYDGDNNSVRAYIRWDAQYSGGSWTVTSSVVPVSVGSAHYVGLVWDPDTKVATLVVDDAEYTADASAQSLPDFDSLDTTRAFRITPGREPTHATDPGIYVDEAMISPNAITDAAALIRHYNNDRAWGTVYSENDLILRPGPGGKVHTDYPAGYIFGLETEAATDADHDVTISPGKCRSYSDRYNLDLRRPLTKRIDATWAAGTDAGGLFSGTVAASTTYHLFLIRKDSDGSIDAGFDTSDTCANIPTGYTAYRGLRTYEMDASANIHGGYPFSFRESKGMTELWTGSQASGTITLFEDVSNFNSILILSGPSNSQITGAPIPVRRLITGGTTNYMAWHNYSGANYYAYVCFASPTTLTVGYISSSIYKIKGVYGVA
jgi:hypothetical protein